MQALAAVRVMATSLVAVASIGPTATPSFSPLHGTLTDIRHQ
jgi:hypothetical protein